MVNFGCLFSIRRDILWKRSRYRMLATGTMHDCAQRRRLRVASGATAPGPALDGAPRFRPKGVLPSLSSYILR